MHKAYGCGNDAGGVGFPLEYEVAQLYQGRGGIAENEKCIGVLLDSEPHTGLCACDALAACCTRSCHHLSHSRVGEIALCLNAQTLQGSFADTAQSHRHIGDNRVKLSAAYLII